MKRILVVFLMALTAALSISCGKTGNSDTKELEPAQQQVQSVVTSQGDSFTVLPERGESALDAAAKTADSIYPAGKDAKRSFGYIGTEKVEGIECYCFKVFDNNNETMTHIADVAVSVDNEKIFSRTAGAEYAAAKV